MMKKPWMRRGVIASLFLLWLTLSAVGLRWLSVYKSTPGPRADAPKTWPKKAGFEPATDAPTLLLFLHPHCDCTDATVSELAEVFAQRSSPVKAVVLVYHPDGVSREWSESPLVEKVSKIPRVTVRRDKGEVERRRFGAVTSGQILLYDKDGALKYNGGITRARGARGDNPGRRALLRLLQGDVAEMQAGPVLGCPLVSSHSLCEGESCCPP